MKITLQFVKNISVKLTKRFLYEYKNLIHHYPLISVSLFILLIISAMGVSSIIQNNITQQQFNSLITGQSNQINDLIKTRKDGFLSQKNTDEEKDITIKELTNVVKDLIKNNNESSVMGANTINESSTLPTSSLPPSLIGMVKTTSSNNSSIPVYEQPVIPGNIIGTVGANKFFFYYQKQPSWYKVELEAGKYGWIHQDFLTEI